MTQTSIPVQQVTCPDCKGSGLIQVTIYNTPAGWPVAYDRPVTYSESCLNCMGAGTVTR